MSKWKKVKINDSFILQMGKTPSRNEPSFWNNPIYNWVAISDMNQKYICSTKEKISQIALEKTGIKKVPKGTIMLSFKLSLGKVSISALDLYTNEAIMSFFPKNKNEWNIDFLYNYFKWLDWGKKAQKAVKGSTLNKNSLGNIEIPLPAMEEQKKIAARLDAVSDLLAKQKQLLSEQDNLIQSTFYDMFLKQNFSKRKIVDFVETDVKNAKKIFNKNNFIKYIDISSIDNDSNIITGYTHIEFCDAPSRAQQVVKKNDILVSTVRPNLKNIALIKFNDNNLVASSGFCVLRAKNIEPVFLLYNVLSQDFTEKMVSAVTGANYPAIKNSDILNYKIPVPPLELQEKFAAIVEQIESEKSKIKSAITETQTLFNALMSEYFED